MSRPTPRKRVKKLAREQKARAKVAQRRRARFEKVAAAVDPSRNLHVERGRPVVVNDITPYQRAGCQKCTNGIASKRHDAEGKVVGAIPCKCATVRFYKAHPEVIVSADGAAFWPLDATDLSIRKQPEPAA